MKKLLLLLSIIYIGQLRAQLCYNPYDSIPVGVQPQAITSADFNGDGKIDLAVANDGINLSASSISILLGDGTGNFTVADTFLTGNGPLSLISADFNGDGKADIATINASGCCPHGIWVFLGTGTGTFGVANNYLLRSGSFPNSIVSADFNGDTKLDLAVSNQGHDSVSVLLGTGTGSFGSVINYDIGFPNESIISSDFNGDGKADLATVNRGSHNISILLGIGTGNFVVASSFAVTQLPSSLCSGNFNGDTKADIAALNPAGNSLDPKPTDISFLLSCTTLGFAKNSATQNISIYPNPTNDQFYFETHTTDNLSVDLYDINGRLVFSAKVMGKSNINVATLDDGIYTLTIKSVDSVTNKKLVIAR